MAFAIQLKDGSLEVWCGAPMLFRDGKDASFFCKDVPLYRDAKVVPVEIKVIA